MSLSRRDVSSTRTTSHHSSIEPRMPPQFDREYAKRLSMARRGRAPDSTTVSPGRQERASVESSVLHSGSFTHLPSLRATVPRLKEFVASHITTTTTTTATATTAATSSSGSGGIAARQHSPSLGRSPDAPPSLAATNPCEPSRLTPTHPPVTFASTASADLADAALCRPSGTMGGAGLITLVPTLNRSARGEQAPLRKSPPSGGGLTADEAASHCTKVLATSPSSAVTAAARKGGRRVNSSRGAASAGAEEEDEDMGGSGTNGRTSWLVQQLRGRGLRPEGRWSAIATLLAAVAVVAALLYCVLVPFTSRGVTHEAFDGATTPTALGLGLDNNNTGPVTVVAGTHSTTSDLAWLRPYQVWATVHQLHRITHLAGRLWRAAQPVVYGTGQMARGLWRGVWGAARARQRVWQVRMSHRHVGRAMLHAIERVTWLPRTVTAQVWTMTHSGVRTVWTTLWALSTRILPPDALSGNYSNASEVAHQAARQRAARAPWQRSEAATGVKEVPVAPVARTHHEYVVRWDENWDYLLASHYDLVAQRVLTELRAALRPLGGLREVQLSSVDGCADGLRVSFDVQWDGARVRWAGGLTQERQHEGDVRARLVQSKFASLRDLLGAAPAKGSAAARSGAEMVDSGHDEQQRHRATADANQLDVALQRLRVCEDAVERLQAQVAAREGCVVAAAAAHSADLVGQQLQVLNTSLATLDTENRRLRVAHAACLARLSATRVRGNTTRMKANDCAAQATCPVSHCPPIAGDNCTVELAACRAESQTRFDVAAQKVAHEVADAQRRRCALAEAELTRKCETRIAAHTNTTIAERAAALDHAEAACARREQRMVSTLSRQCNETLRAARNASARRLADALRAAEQDAQANYTAQLKSILQAQAETEAARWQVRCGREVNTATHAAEARCSRASRDAQAKLTASHTAELLQQQQLLRERVVADFSSVCEAAQQVSLPLVPRTHCGRYAAELLTELQPSGATARDAREANHTFTLLLDHLHRLWLREDESRPHCVLRWSALVAAERPTAAVPLGDASCVQHPYLSAAVSRFSFAVVAMAVVFVLRTYRKQHLCIAQLRLRNTSLQAELDALVATAVRAGTGPLTLAQMSAVLDVGYEVLESWHVMCAACLLRQSAQRVYATCGGHDLPFTPLGALPDKATHTDDDMLAGDELALLLPLSLYSPSPNHAEGSAYAERSQLLRVSGRLLESMLAAYFALLDSYHVDLLRAVVHRELATEAQRGLEAAMARQKTQLQRQSSAVTKIQAELAKQQTEMATLHTAVEAEYGAAQEQLTSQLHHCQAARQTLETALAERGAELQHMRALADTQAETIAALEAELQHLGKPGEEASATSPTGRRATEGDSLPPTDCSDMARQVDGTPRREDGSREGAAHNISDHAQASVEATAAPPLSSFITVPSSMAGARLQSPRLVTVARRHNGVQRIRHYRHLSWNDDSDELSN